jgi:hypothetical protein
MIRTVILTITLLLGTAALADTPLPGVRFDIMPVGCRIHGIYSNGDTTIREYVGKVGDTFQVKIFKGTTLTMTSTLDSNGFSVRNDMADGKWETFTPYSCLLESGNCSFVSRNSEGRQRTYKGKVVQDGAKLTTTGGFVGQDAIPISHMTLGRFNTIETLSNGEITFQVTKYEDCGKP